MALTLLLVLVARAAGRQVVCLWRNPKMTECLVREPAPFGECQSRALSPERRWNQ